jgi:hypothetical protein|nr:MAG TPA: hypothetical protein [Caudoviricetes sp.]
MNYELSDKLKGAIEEEVARLTRLSEMSGEVVLGEDFCFTPTQGMHAGYRVNIFAIHNDGSKIQVGEKVYTFGNHLWRKGDSWITETSGGLALECREARRAGKIVEILEIGEDTENDEGEEK